MRSQLSRPSEVKEALAKANEYEKLTLKAKNKRIGSITTNCAESASVSRTVGALSMRLVACPNVSLHWHCVHDWN